MSAQDTLARLLVQIREEGGKRTTNVLKGVNKGMKDVSATQERVTRGTGEMSSNSTKNFSKMSQGLSGVVHVYASLAANIFAASAAFRALSEAADYERMINASKQLSIQTGQNFASVAKSLKDVSAGAIDMQTAMQTANLGLAAGFSGGQMQKITKLATQAGIALGRSVPDAISRLTTAIVKGEPELTDELGIILRLKEATDDYAKARGKAAKDLTTGERLQAVYQQAIERGTPKYGAIDIEPQAYDKLLSSIKEVSKEFGNIVNVVLKPFISLLASSKVILGAIFLILGKILLTKTTHLFGDGLDARLLKINESLSDMITNTQKIQNEYKYYKEISSSKRGGIYTEDALEGIGRSLESMKGGKLPKATKRAIADKLGAEDIARTFTARMADEVQEKFPEAMTKAISDNEKNFQFQDKNRKEIVSIPLDTATNISAAEQLGEEVRNLNEINKAHEKNNGSLRKSISYIKFMGAAYSSFELKLKSASLLGIGAGLSKGLDKVKENYKEINRQLEKSNFLTRTLVKGTFGLSFALGKTARGLDIIAAGVSKLMGWFAAIALVFGLINKITGLWTGNLSKASDSLAEAKDIAAGIKETLNSVIINPKNMDQYIANLTKMANAVGQYSEAINKAGDAISTAAKAGKLEKLVDSFFGETKIREASKDLRDYFADAILGLKSMPGGDKAAEELLKNLSLDNVVIKTKIEVNEESISKTKQLVASRTALLSRETSILNSINAKNKEGLAMQSKRVAEQANSLEKSILAYNVLRGYQEDNKNGVGEIYVLERRASELLKGRTSIYEDLASGDIERVTKAAEFVMEIEKSENAAGLLKAIIAQIPAELQIATANAIELGTALANAGRNLASIMQKFSQIKNAALVKDIITAKADLKKLQENPDVIPGPSIEKGRFKKMQENIDAMQAVLKFKMEAPAKKVIKGLNNTVNTLAEATTRTKKQMDKTKATLSTSMETTAVKIAESNIAIAGHLEKGNKGLAKVEVDTRNELIKELQATGKAYQEIDAMGPLKKASGGGGGGKHKPEKFRGNEAQIELERLRAAQKILEHNMKSANTTSKIRVEAATALVSLEMKLFDAKMKTLEANKADAEINMTKGKDANARSKAALEYAKANVGIAILLAEIEDKMIQRRIEEHETRGKAGQAGAGMVVFELKKTFRDLLNNLESWTETFSRAISDVFQATTNSLAEALVNGENDIAESISEALKSSAIDLIDKGLQEVLLRSLSGIIPGLGGGEQMAQIDHTAAMRAHTTALTVASGFVGPPPDLAGSASSGGTGIVGNLFNWGASLISRFFANGGILDHVNAYANGTIARRPELALIGEGSKNEAIVPLPDNRSIPVNLNGQGGNTNNSNVNITINSDGSSDVESDNSGEKGAELARVMTIAIKKQLMTEQRPGGLLFTGRR